ncbi:MAG TPA: NAD(P)H-dependent glycerol-3-phosphate dehydrogenase [Terriglobales bacterium]|jgi:glycerol-3-phosphate dehydrogenase (NAD(P)+)
MSRISILGAGAWGTALAIVLGRKGIHEVRLWAREKEVCDAIASHQVNDVFLPGCPIPKSVSVTTEYEHCIQGAEIVVCAVPSQHCRAIFQEIKKYLQPQMLLVSATKGLEQSSLLRMTSVIAEVVGAENGPAPRVGALSGPSFAKEVAQGDPTAITIASADAALAETVQQRFSDASFRVYRNDDVTGVELGGALKNVVAIAAGICNGLGLGHNSIAALITRGLAEITRLVVACGGREQTMAGLAGLGDLVLTCTGELSRNRSVGVELGRGRKLPEILSNMRGTVAEGIFTTYAAVGLARAHGIEMPITEQMHSILRDGKPPREAIHELMTRSAKSEISLGS